MSRSTRSPHRLVPMADSGVTGSGVLVPRRPRTREEAVELPADVGWPPSPPSDSEDGFDGGGGGGGGDEGQPRGGDDSRDVAMFALRLALAAVTTLFVVFLAAWLLLLRGDSNAGPGSFRPSGVIWISTLALLASSATLQRSLEQARAQRGVSRRWLATSLALGVTFLFAQAFIWAELYETGHVPATNGYGAMFYVLTGFHALHVLVGLAYLAWLLPTRRPLRIDALRLGATYWHFMTGIWIVLFVVLFVVR